MSQQNVEMTREFIEGYNRRDFDAALANCDPEVEWVLPALQESDSGRGTDAIRRFFDGIDETFDELRLVPQEFVDGGDRVAVRLRHHARGKGSGIELDAELYHQVNTFEDGRVVRIEYFTTWPAALEAAGVPDAGPA
jgi:ketosteroid isomerase-like protein